MKELVKEMNKNYLQLQSYSPFSFFYVFIDTVDHIYERIMKKNGIILKGIKEYIKAESPFRLIACHVKKSDEPAFFDAIKQIRNTALLYGYRDYDDMCLLMQKCEIDLLNQI